jgi:hypothetical protein
VDRLGQVEGTRVLVEKARSGFQEELRQSRRFPFFQPVTVDAEQDGRTCISAFSRDISAWGIGLLLNCPLKLRAVNLRIHFSADDETAVTGVVRWCQPCGHGWYLAGISFNDGSCDEIGYMVGGCTG